MLLRILSTMKMIFSTYFLVLGQEYNPVVFSVLSKVDPIPVGDVGTLLLSFEARLEGVST